MSGRAQVIEVPGGGHGSYTWTASRHVTNRYTIRRGARVDGYLTLAAHVTDVDTVLDQFCQTLHDTQGDHP